MTHCNRSSFAFQDLGSRQVVAAFDGGKVTSDGGGPAAPRSRREVWLPRTVRRLLHRSSRLPTWSNTPGRTAQAAGLRSVPGLRRPQRSRPLAARSAAGRRWWARRIPSARTVCTSADRGKALAGKSTLNRLELTAVGATPTAATRRSSPIWARSKTYPRRRLRPATAPRRRQRIVLDLDATDDPAARPPTRPLLPRLLRRYCYLPLYIFCGDHPLCALLRPSDIDGSAGCSAARATVGDSAPPGVAAGASIVLRGDSGFCREYLMRWCEANDVDYLFGLAKNQRLLRALGQEMHAGQMEFVRSGQAARVFKDFSYRTLNSWSRTRRVVGKAEHLAKGSNPRFVVTSLTGRGVRRGDALRTGVLRPGRHGEPHQGAAVVAVCRSRCAVRRCGPTKCVYIWRPWPTCCCVRCVSSA